jgi:hypothetical protein
MDSLERLAHSLEAGVALIQSLRRENRELARQAGEAGAKAQDNERARQAELESASLAERLETERAEQQAFRTALEAKVRDLELRLLAAERDETMPLPDRGPEVESLSRRCAELEVMLAESQAALEKAKGDITAMQVRIAESADASEVEAWQRRMQEMSGELESLRHLAGMKEKLEADRAEMRRQKRNLALITGEREATRRKLEEIYAALDNMRLS